MSKLDPLARIMTMNSKGHPGRPGKNQTMERRLKRVEREATAAVLAYDLPGQEPVGVYSQLPDASTDYIGHIALVRGGAGQRGGVYIGDQLSDDTPFWREISGPDGFVFSRETVLPITGGISGSYGLAAGDDRFWAGYPFSGIINAYKYDGTAIATYGTSATLADNPGWMAYDATNQRVGIIGTDANTLHGFQVWSKDFSTRIFQVSANGSGNGQFSTARGIAVDTSGNWYIVDNGNSRVQKFNSAGAYQAQWGTAGTGNGQFTDPWGIAVDSSGNIHVVDKGNYRIQKFSNVGTFLLSYGSRGNGPGQFDNVNPIACSNNGLVFVGDATNFCVHVFSSDGVYLSRINSTNDIWSSFVVPASLAIYQDRLLICTQTPSIADVWRINAISTDDTGLYIPFLLRTRLSDVAADYEWTNQPAALTEMGTIRTRRKVDLSRYRDIRFMLEVNQTGVAGSDLLLRYSLDASSWTTITGTTLAIDSTGTKDSGWVSIPAAARDAVFLAVWGQDGNATADPQFNWIVAQVR